jgi:general stress protein 26
MKQIKKNPEVAICAEWFTAHGTGENLGHVLAERNTDIMVRIRAAFALWYDNGHTDESDPHTCLLRIHLTDGILMNDGTQYKINFRA